MAGSGSSCRWPWSPRRGRPESLATARIYHATHPLTGRLAVRGRLLADDPDAGFPAAVARYQRALRASDLEGLLACWAEDCSARNGHSPTAVGPDAVRAFFTRMFAAGGGGFELEHPLVSDDGSACVLEFTAVRWGSQPIVPQAGVAVYEHADGLLRAVRIYDEITDRTPRLA